MSNRARLADGYASIPVPTAVPVGPDGVPLIPELANRDPTPHEREMISGDWVAPGSTNVEQFRWLWESRCLEVQFLDGSIYSYPACTLAIAAGFVMTDSPGRYVRNVVRVKLGDGDKIRDRSAGPRKGPQRVTAVLPPKKKKGR